jgi:c(7)-type cytochrome triheme protein
MKGFLNVCFILGTSFFISAFIYKGANAQLQKEFAPVFKGIKSPGNYGSIVLDKYTGLGEVMNAVVFPHWWHRTQFTCKVCHNDIGFPMKAGSTDIKMADIFAGKYCGRCHNGDIAFAPFTCDRCHSLGKIVKENRKIEETLKYLPKDDFGNKVDWVKALRYDKLGMRPIDPKASLDGKEEMWVFDRDIDLPVTKFLPHPPDVVYPHKAHTEWLHCGSCHPSVFNMKAGENPEMSMRKIIAGKYCGVCHGKVAFPLEDCFRCHSKVPEVPDTVELP